LLKHDNKDIFEITEGVLIENADLF